MFDEMIALIVATAILGDEEVTIIEIPDGPKMSTLSVPMGRERDTGRRSDIRAQRAGMIPCLPSQDLIRLRKLNDSRAFGPVITKIPPMDEVLRRHSWTATRLNRTE